MSLPSLTVISHSHRRSRIPLPRHCAAVGADFAVPGVASGSVVRGLGSRRHCWLFGCGLVGSGLVVGVCHFCALYLVYLTGLPMLLSVPASCHCDRCFCHSPYTVPTAYPRSDASYGCCTYLCIPAPARCIVAYASKMRCMLPTYRSMFCTITFGAYRTFGACVRSICAVRNHFFLLMFCFPFYR
jgi:hypothetical protein